MTDTEKRMTRRVSLLLDPEFFERVAAAARRKSLPVNTLIRLALVDYLERIERNER